MEIEFKFELGDHIHVLENGEIVLGEIISRYYTENRSRQKNIEYAILTFKKYHLVVYENDVFRNEVDAKEYYSVDEFFKNVK